MVTVKLSVVRVALVASLAVLIGGVAFGHPPSAIVADRQGQVYFVDTAVGVWKIDPAGKVVRHPGPHYHFIAIDPTATLRQRDVPRHLQGDISVLADPTLVLSGGFPVAVAADGALLYPEVAGDGRVQLLRLAPEGKSSVLATLPAAVEIGPDGKVIQAQWIHGLAVGADGSVYYAEKQAIRKIAPDGTLSMVANDIADPDCRHPSAIPKSVAGPVLRDLEVAPDGTIYVAASACSALLKIDPRGNVSVVLRGTDDWSPMGVTWSNGDLYVLEYRYIETQKSTDWRPRVRRVSSDGKVSLVASVDRQ